MSLKIAMEARRAVKAKCANIPEVVLVTSSILDKGITIYVYCKKGTKKKVRALLPETFLGTRIIVQDE